jgi:hypothetical protein
MSIAAQSSTFVSAVRDFAAQVSAAGAAAAPRRAAPEPREAGRRHDLVDAMNQVLSVEGKPAPSGEPAVFRFAHALMHDLRTMEGSGEREGASAGKAQDHVRGPAWGRRQWNDMPQRIDALATATAASAARAAAAAPNEATAPAAAPVAAAPAVSADVPAREVPPQPNPLTTTSAALHLMRVPTSHLLEAYAALHKALGEQANAPAEASPRADLAVFLQRLSHELAADAPATLPAGSMLNRTA